MSRTLGIYAPLPLSLEGILARILSMTPGIDRATRCFYKIEETAYILLCVLNFVLFRLRQNFFV